MASRFEDRDSVRRAIDRWHGVRLLPDLPPLVVDLATYKDPNRPRSFDDANRRERQARGNYAPDLSRQPSVNTIIRYDPNVPYIPGSSHSTRSSSLETTGFPVSSQFNSRRSSAGQGVIGTLVGSQINSSFVEVAQHQFALNRLKEMQTPLERIANHKNFRYQSKERGVMDGPVAQVGLDKKENFPMASPHKTPSRNKGKKKSFRQNTPPQPLAASSPSHSGSGQVEEKLTLDVPKGQKKKYSSKKKSSSFKSDTMLAGSSKIDSTSSTLSKNEATTAGSMSSTSFKSDMAISGFLDEAISPVTTERTEDTRNYVNSCNTSFSTFSSRKPSDATTFSDQGESRHLGLENEMVGNASTGTEMAPKCTITGSYNNKPAPSKSDDAKPELKVQKINHSSTRKSDSSAATQVALDYTPKVNGGKIESQDEWPALNPAKSSVSSIADGKRPPPPTIRPPTSGPSGDRKTDKDSNKNKKVRRAVPIIAVPHTFLPRSQP